MKNKKRLVAIMSLVLAAIMLITLLVGLIPTHTHAAKLTSDKLEELQKQLDAMEDEKKKNKGLISEIVGGPMAEEAG